MLAEDIDASEVMQHLVSIGYEYEQRFFIAQPMPAAEMLEWIDSPVWEKHPCGR